MVVVNFIGQIVVSKSLRPSHHYREPRVMNTINHILQLMNIVSVPPNIETKLIMAYGSTQSSSEYTQQCFVHAVYAVMKTAE